MPTADLTLHTTELRNYTALERGAKVVEYMRHVFYLGEHGPFTELYPRDDFSDAMVTARIDQIRNTIRNIHR